MQADTIRQKLSADHIQERFRSSWVSHLAFFGSYARNEATKKSDLDLLIELSPDGKTTLATLDELELFLTKELQVNWVDFVTNRKLSSYLRAQIESDKITVF